MIKEAIVKIVNKEDLTYDEAYSVMNEIMSGETTATQNAAFLAALSTKSAPFEKLAVRLYDPADFDLEGRFAEGAGVFLRRGFI